MQSNAKKDLVFGEVNQRENAELFVEKGVKMQNLSDFIFIDFETTGRDLAGRYYFDKNVPKQDAVQIGLVWYEGSEFISAYSYIKPPSAYFNLEWSFASPKKEFSENAPTFDKLFPILVGLVGKKTFVAHNANFDKKVMEDTLDYYNKPMFTNEWLCTKDMSKEYFTSPTKCFNSCKSDCSGHTLSHLHHEFGFGDYLEHDAVADTMAVANIFQILYKDKPAQEKPDWIFV